MVIVYRFQPRACNEQTDTGGRRAGQLVPAEEPNRPCAMACNLQTCFASCERLRPWFHTDVALPGKVSFHELGQDDDVPSAFLAAYLLYRQNVFPGQVPKKDTLLLNILQLRNPMLLLAGRPLSVLSALRGSFLHSATKSSGDKTCRLLQKVLELTAFATLPPWEQLGYIVMACYVRTPELAAYFLKEATSATAQCHRLSLAGSLVAFFKVTHGVRARKRFLLTRRVQRCQVDASRRQVKKTVCVKPKTDLSSFTLGVAFMTGRWQLIFLMRSRLRGECLWTCLPRYR